MGGGPAKRFDEHYRCYPTVMLQGPDRDHVNFGGKIVMPPSALEKLARLHIEYPMMFELINGNAGKTTHAGVLEFVAEEGKVYLPQWVWANPPILQESPTDSAIDDGEPTRRCWRYPTTQIHQLGTRISCQTPTAIYLLPRYLRPQSRT